MTLKPACVNTKQHPAVARSLLSLLAWSLAGVFIYMYMQRKKSTFLTLRSQIVGSWSEEQLISISRIALHCHIPSSIPHALETSLPRMVAEPAGSSAGARVKNVAEETTRHASSRAREGRPSFTSNTHRNSPFTRPGWMDFLFGRSPVVGRATEAQCGTISERRMTPEERAIRSCKGANFLSARALP